MEFIDLRSDTVTHPTPAMREAMANAPVGDDVYGEDPTVNQLQDEAAALLGKEAALFVNSGTMGNLLGVICQAARGEEVIVAKKSHIFQSEAANAAVIGGVQLNTLDIQPDGTIPLPDLLDAIRPDDQHYPRTALICLENTQAGAGGAPLPANYVRHVGLLAHEKGLKLHIDGARLFNAAAALNVPARDLVTEADSVTFCLSKGLCAPIGSLLVGSKDLIEKAKRARKMLGGGTRQAGIVAAAGLIALREMTQRLQGDHATARTLAEELARIPGVEVNLEQVRTNILYFTLNEQAAISPEELAERLWEEHQILIGNNYGTSGFRLVTHYWITPERVESVIDGMKALLA